MGPFLDWLLPLECETRTHTKVTRTLVTQSHINSEEFGEGKNMAPRFLLNAPGRSSLNLELGGEL